MKKQTPIFTPVWPTKFRITITNVGLDTISAGYKRKENDNAARLALDVCHIMADQFIGQERGAEFEYDLALLLLKKVTGWEGKNLLKDINDADERMKKWTLRKKPELTGPRVYSKIVKK